MIKDIENVVLEKPKKLPKMKKEKISCDNCGKAVDKFQESKDYKWAWCEDCQQVISQKLIAEKITE